MVNSRAAISEPIVVKPNEAPQTSVYSTLRQWVDILQWRKSPKNPFISYLIICTLLLYKSGSIVSNCDLFYSYTELWFVYIFCIIILRVIFLVIGMSIWRYSVTWSCMYALELTFGSSCAIYSDHYWSWLDYVIYSSGIVIAAPGMCQCCMQWFYLFISWWSSLSHICLYTYLILGILVIMYFIDVYYDFCVR